MQDNHIDYVEFKANDLEKIKAFYSKVFKWRFTDYGSDYTAFESSGIAGGFEKTETKVSNGALVVLYHSDLQSTKEKVLEAGGNISKDIFYFPGGKRFHFVDPSGNELGVWSE